MIFYQINVSMLQRKLDILYYLKTISLYDLLFNNGSIKTFIKVPEAYFK